MPVGETHKRQQSEAPVACRWKKRRARCHREPECLHLKATSSPLVSSSTGRSYGSVCLSADRVYTLGRGKRYCDFCFRDPRVSRRHCQVLFDSYERKVFIIDGSLCSSSELGTDKVQESSGRENGCSAHRGSNCSLNGVYVNGSKLKGRSIFHLSVGDVVSFVCGSRSNPIGFVVECIFFTDEIVTISNAESICGSGNERCCDNSSVRLQCLQSVYERLSKLYFSRTSSPVKVIYRKTMLSDVGFSQDSIDSLCRRFVHVSGHYEQTTNRRRRVRLFEVDQGASNLALHDASKVGDASGRIPTGLMGTNNLLSLSRTCKKRPLKRGHFCGSYSDGELILRALVLLKKCRLARKDLNSVMCFDNNFGNSSAFVGRRLGKAEAFVEGSFPPTAYGGTYNQFNRPDVHPKVTDLILCDPMSIEHGKSNLVTDRGSFGSAPSRELDRCTEVSDMNIELNERYFITKRGECFASSREIREVSVIGDCVEKIARILVTGTNQSTEHSLPSYGGNVGNETNLFSAEKIGGDACKMRTKTESAIQDTFSHTIVGAQSTAGCAPSIPRVPSPADGRRELMNEKIEGLNRNKEIHTPKSDGETLFLNRLEFTSIGSTDKPASVSLSELLSPVESLSRVFIATFTSNILWFFSACNIPNNLPVTVACHDTERCWNPVHEQRWSQPYAQYPNLVVVHPPFPDEIAFAKDKKKKGIACHHPKLLLLLREESIRVVITSANLVPKQWNNVTNTIWWQDFPRRKFPEYFYLFTDLHRGREEISEESESDFLAQLAGFVASLVVNIPNQAYWIKELCHYDFTKASCHLVASIPGIHESMFPHNLEHVHHLSELQHIQQTAAGCSKFVGCVLASLVGLSHRFQAKVDPGGMQLKALASVIQKCKENAYGMLEVILQRNHCIPADSNAVSVTISHPAECSEQDASCEDHLQLGFLPRSVAKWVAPLCDASLFTFSAYVFPRQVLAAALSGCNSRVKLILYVSQGPNFFKISNLVRHEHVVAICYLLASIQRNLGIWRLHEVLSKYQWPDSEELDFVYGASSIGSSLNSHFLAAFALAAGKRSSQFLDSEESDPEWGLWNAEHESYSPSIKIIFPTIERVKLGASGIWPYRRLLSCSEKTWQRLKAADILYDAIPHPSERVGHPMHVKVARRCFWNKATSSSFGWIYCGSHNLSAAAWGYPLTNSPESVSVSIGSSVLGSRLHISNYELGLVLVVPPALTPKGVTEKNRDFDNIILPFVMPAPKYKVSDRPATMQAMREACAVELQKQMTILVSGEEDFMNEDIIDDEDEDIIEVTDSATEEKEEEKLYGERLWSQVDSADA